MGKLKSAFDGNSSELLIYCRKCTKNKKKTEFYGATDLLLDSNGYMSICKDCVQELYEGYYNTERSVDKALLRLCRTLNVLYLQSASEGLKTSIENKVNDDKDIGNIFGVYKRLLSPHARGVDTTGANDLTFVEPNLNVIENINEISIGDDESYKSSKLFWGGELAFEDYEFLEYTLSEWKKTHKCDTMAELTLLKEICFKQLEIDKDRRENKKVSGSLLKDLQDLMKTASLDPAKEKLSDAGKSQQTFSDFIKIIESNEPAEYYKGEDRKIFQDVDNINFYFEKYVTRPLKNFVTQSRDFSIEAEDENEADDDDNISLSDMSVDKEETDVK